MSAGQIPATETITRKPRFGHLDHVPSAHTRVKHGGASHSPAPKTNGTIYTNLPAPSEALRYGGLQMLKWRQEIHAATRKDLQQRLESITRWQNQPAATAPADIPAPCATHGEVHTE